MDGSRSFSATHLRDWALAVPASPASQEHARSVEERVCLYFEQFGGPVKKYLAYACRNDDDAEDLTQEVFIRLYRALAGGKEIENVRHWSFHVARNLVIDRSKHLKVLARRECELRPSLGDTLADPAPSPEECLVTQTRNDALREAFKMNLTELQQRCVALRAEGYMLREIAEMLDMDIRRVAEAIQRGVKNIRRAFDK